MDKMSKIEVTMEEVNKVTGGISDPDVKIGADQFYAKQLICKLLNVEFNDPRVFITYDFNTMIFRGEIISETTEDVS